MGALPASTFGRPEIGWASPNNSVQYLHSFGGYFNGQNELVMRYYDRECEEWAAGDLTLGKVDNFRDVVVTQEAEFEPRR